MLALSRIAPGLVARHRGMQHHTIAGAALKAQPQLVGDIGVDVGQPVECLVTVAEHIVKRGGILGYIVKIIIAR